MRIDSDEWTEATKYDGMIEDALEVLVEAHPDALTKADIIEEWSRPEYPNDGEKLAVLLEVMVTRGEVEVAEVDGVAGQFYRADNQ